MSTYYSDHALTLLVGDAAAQLRSLSDSSVDCVVTSPPYFGLRDYAGHVAQFGLEKTPAEYVAKLVDVFREVRRVLAKDGTCWLNLGDSYSGSWGNQSHKDGRQETSGIGLVHDERFPSATRTGAVKDGAPPAKNLMGMPWRTAFALQDDGWILRNAIVWHKPNAMPESVRDRLAGRHEHVFLLARSHKYYFDLDAIREPHAESTIAAAHRARKPYQAPGQKPNTKSRPLGDKGANPGDVWSINTRPLTEAHFASFPVELPRRCIAAGCKPGGTVLDPFSGAGTTALAAQQLGRKAIGIDINPEYHDIALRRMQDAPLPFGEEIA